jgi:hypothetical protein
MILTFCALGVRIALRNVFRGNVLRPISVRLQQTILLALCGVFLSACTNIGPETVERDRFDYNTAISKSWKQQTLLNIVKLRYADMPVFVEVVSVVSGYTLEGSVNAGGTVSSNSAITGDFLSLGGAAKFTDRPTITYAPITGNQFNKSFMTPLPPQAVLFLMQHGWPADLILPLTVDSINGLRSEVAAGASQREGDSRFYRVVKLLREIQTSGAVGMRIQRANDGNDTTVMFFNNRALTPEIKVSLGELGALLGLKRGLREATVRYGLLPRSNNEIMFLTRSLLHIMISLATQVDVPPEHVSQGRTVASLPLAAGEQDRRIIKIHHSVDKPPRADTAVKYKGYWFWIDDGDFTSKRSFAFLMILFSLTETGGREGLPLVTIPAG